MLAGYNWTGMLRLATQRVVGRSRGGAARLFTSPG